jgi:hypothetical protein
VTKPIKYAECNTNSKVDIWLNNNWKWIHRFFVALFLASFVVAVVIGLNTQSYLDLGDYRFQIHGWFLLFSWPIDFGKALWNSPVFMGLAIPSWSYMGIWIIANRPCI